MIMNKCMMTIFSVSLLMGSGQVFAEDITPYSSTPVQPYQATPVQPYQSTPVQPYQSTPVLPYNPQVTNPAVAPANAQPIDYALKTFILWVPGTSYVIPNFDAHTSTLYTSTGTLPKSTITINKDGTYIWNSAYDGKIIVGKWTKNDDNSLNILLGQEGKTWRLAKGGGQYEDIFLMDGFSWYSGKAVTLVGPAKP